MNLLEDVKQELKILDELLIKIDCVLDSAQPNLEGKIRIKFWSVNGNKEPFLVSRTKRPTKIPKKICEKNLTKRAKSSGLFLKNYQVTNTMLNLTSELLKYRKSLKAIIVDTERKSRATLNGNFKRLYKAEELILKTDKTIHKDMIEQNKEGYYRNIGKQIFKDD